MLLFQRNAIVTNFMTLPLAERFCILPNDTAIVPCHLMIT